MCELLNSTRRLAKKKNLDPRDVVCPPDKQVLCTGANCVLLEILETNPAILPAKQVENFYAKLEKSLRLIRERRNKGTSVFGVKLVK